MGTATLTPTLTTLVADVVSGDALPVAGIAVDVWYAYRDGARRHGRAVTDGDGQAVLVDGHHTLPHRVGICVAGEAAEMACAPAMRVVVEV